MPRDLRGLVEGRESFSFQPKGVKSFGVQPWLWFVGPLDGEEWSTFRNIAEPAYRVVAKSKEKYCLWALQSKEFINISMGELNRDWDNIIKT